ncbi:hypothetical protein [Nitrobacter vulgaris]|uniref:hypothetical protein n=1 Tax=Nitrobacter vulgaris TaxID=29421 RepID=UPI001301E4E4|nr:hypothetical protein [Nitrobacter vulgaris]
MIADVGHRVEALPVEGYAKGLEALLDIVDADGIATDSFDRNLALIVRLRLEALGQQDFIIRGQSPELLLAEKQDAGMDIAHRRKHASFVVPQEVLDADLNCFDCIGE